MAIISLGPIELYVTEEYFQNPLSSYVPPPFLDGAPFTPWDDPTLSLSNISHIAIWQDTGYSTLAARVRMNATLGQLKQVGVNECNKAESNFFQNQYESLVYVQTSKTSENNSFLNIGYSLWSYRYSDPTQMTECWAGAAKGLDCQLFFDLNLMIIVVVANLIKSCVMILIVLKFTKPSLVTLGDAIASFLANEDCTTIGLRAIKKHKNANRGWVMKCAVPYKQENKRWGSSPGGLSWTLSLLMRVVF